MRLAVLALASAALVASPAQARSLLGGVGYGTTGVGAAETIEFGTESFQNFSDSFTLAPDDVAPSEGETPAAYVPDPDFLGPPAVAVPDPVDAAVPVEPGSLASVTADSPAGETPLASDVELVGGVGGVGGQEIVIGGVQPEFEAADDRAGLRSEGFGRRAVDFD